METFVKHVCHSFPELNKNSTNTFDDFSIVPKPKLKQKLFCVNIESLYPRVIVLISRVMKLVK